MLRRCAARLLASVSPDDVAAAFRVLGLSYTPKARGSGSTRGGTTSSATTAAAAAAARPTLDTVRQRYRELARLHHPDLGGGDDTRMKVINTAYELIQSSGVLHTTNAAATATTTATAATATRPHTRGSTTTPFQQRAGTRRRRVPDDFASGDDTAWAMRSELDWRSMVTDTSTLTEQELRNPANHPFSHSKFFSFDDDVSIYRMLRGGATVRQVARTLGMSATFVEKRLHNAQFRNRIQYILRAEKRMATADEATTATAAAAAARKGSSNRRARHAKADGAAVDGDDDVTMAPPAAPDMTRRALRYAVDDDGSDPAAAAAAAAAAQATAAATAAASRPRRVREWHATMPRWHAPEYFATMTLEEKGRYAKLLREEAGDGGSSGTSRGSCGSAASVRSRPMASSMGRSYHNYARLRPRATST